ncbi:Proline--tRNA ligase [Austwickia sp. TVS 96-490-7B]|nr:Proline--tRNA ligase [Austwickia sp. TVS 96-490-7B]
MGTAVLQRLERALLDALDRRGFYEIQLPAIVPDRDLEQGQPVGSQFESKICRLGGVFEGHHLISTPEMMIARLASEFEISHHQLPLRQSFATRIYRQASRPKSLLTGREFRLVGALSLVERAISAESVQKELDLFDAALFEVARLASVELHQARGSGGASELATPSVDGDIRLPDGRRGLSLSVGYHYTDGVEVPATYRDTEYVSRHPLVMTAGVCTNRLLFSCFDQTRDDRGFALTPLTRPFDVIVVPCAARDTAAAQAVAVQCAAWGARVAVDDRVRRKVTSRVDFSKYIGAPVSVIVRGESLVCVSRVGPSLTFDAGVRKNAAWRDQLCRMIWPGQ